MTGPSRTRARLLATTLPMVLTLVGCTSYRVETGPVAQVVAEREPRSVLITLGSEREVEVFGPVVSDDSLRGHPRAEAVQRVSYALSDIRTIKTRRFNLGKSLLYVAIAAGGVAVYELLMSLNSTAF
ncbi:MAG: hypothetical protein KJZ47_09600 [Gemmatimonadales bacterium]|nr:hypothetical protein [Gemmatimonadales bacterium]